MSSSAQVCTDPHNHVHDADAYVSEVSRLCEARGLRLTDLRERVLRLVAEEGKPVKAYDLLERMRAVQGPVAPPTVYRALDFLLEGGFIHKLQSINAYVGCHHPHAQHHVPFLICNLCQEAIELEDEQVSDLLNQRALALGFQPASQTLEVRGICAACRKHD